MITFHLTLDKRRSKKDGTYPIVFRLTSNSSSRDISTGYSSLETDWNKRSGTIKESHPLYAVVAPRLKELEVEYLGKLIDYEKTGSTDTNIQSIKEYLTTTLKEAPTTTVYSFWNDEITKLHKANRNGGAIVYQQALDAIKKIKDLNIPFEQVTYSFLSDVEVEFLNNSLAINSISVYLRCLRALYNKAIKSKIVKRDHYPFEEFKISKQATTPRPISREELSKYFHLTLDKNSTYYDSWLMGKLMFMLIGSTLWACVDVIL